MLENERHHYTCLGRRYTTVVDASEVHHYTLAVVRLPTDAEVPTDLIVDQDVPTPLAGSHQEVAVHQEDHPADRLEFSELVSPMVFHHDDLESASALVDLSHTPHHSQNQDQDDQVSSVVHPFANTWLPVEVELVHPKNAEEAGHHHIVDRAAIPCSLIEDPSEVLLGHHKVVVDISHLVVVHILLRGNHREAVGRPWGAHLCGVSVRSTFSSYLFCSNFQKTNNLRGSNRSY